MDFVAPFVAIACGACRVGHTFGSDVSADFIRVSTERTISEYRDRGVRWQRADWVADYPDPSSFLNVWRGDSGNNYTGQFNLTIKAKTKVVDIPFTLTQSGGASTIKGSFKINRLDYGIGTSSLVLADEVTVNVDVTVRD